MIKRQSTKSFLAPSADHRSAQGDLSAPSQSRMADEQDTAAMSSLRRMSQATKAFSMSKAQSMRRISRALTAAFHNGPESKLGPDSTTVSDLDQDFVPPITQDILHSFVHGTKAQSSQTHYDGTHRASALNREAVDAPTSITLRKPSNAYFFVIEPKDVKKHSVLDSRVDNSDPTAASYEPSVALMDFRSKRLAQPRRSIWYSLPLLSNQDQPEIPEPDKSETATVQTDISTPTPYSPAIQPSTLPSDTAITFSSVHPTPSTFSANRRSRGTSVSSQKRRTSTIRIKSRSSIHQIIWAEDANANTSSGSSSSFPSPIEAKSAGPSLIAGNMPYAEITHSLPASPGYMLAPSGPGCSLEENIFEWSWSKHSDRVLDENRSFDPPQISPVEEASSRPSRRRPSVSKDSSVESFPPLLDRKNTTEWRTAPLGDINDPMIGKGGKWMPVMEKTEEHLEGDQGNPRRWRDEHFEDTQLDAEVEFEHGNLSGIGTTGAADQDEDELYGCIKRRANSHPFAPARLAERGRVGSSLGASNHKRVSWTRF